MLVLLFTFRTDISTRIPWQYFVVASVVNMWFQLTNKKVYFMAGGIALKKTSDMFKPIKKYKYLIYTAQDVTIQMTLM